MPTDISPQALQRLAAQGLSQVLLALRDNPGPLADQLEKLIQQHWAALSAAPEQLALQLRARLPRSEASSAWLDAAGAVEREAGLVLRSRTLSGPERVERWSRKPHSALVHALIQLPDGDTIVSAGEDSQLLAWSLSRDDQPPTNLQGHSGPVNHLALSGDGTLLASAGDDHRVGLWSLKGGQPGKVKLLEGHSHYVRQVAFGPEVLVSVSQDGTARVWAIPSGKLVHTLEHGQDVMSLAISSDGGLLATTTINSALHLWDLRSGEKLAQLYGNQDQVMRVMGDIYLSGTNTSEIGHKDYPRALGFADGDTVLWTMGSELIVWDVAERKERIHHPSTTQYSAHDLCWLDHERVAIGGNGLFVSRVRRGDTWLGAGQAERLASLGVGRENTTALRLLSDGRTLLSGHQNGTITAWDMSVDPSALPVSEHGGPVWEIERSPSGRYLASKAGDNSICVWDTESGACLDRAGLSEPNSYGGWCSFSPDERQLALADGKGHLMVRDLAGGEHKRLRIEHEKNYQALSSVAFSAEPGVLYAGLATAGLFRVDLGEQPRVQQFKGFAASPARIWTTPDGRTVVCEDNFAPSEKEDDWRNNVYHLVGWDSVSLERRFRVSAEKGAEREYVSFGEPRLMPEGLVSLSGKRKPSLVLRDLQTGEVTRTFALPAHWISSLRSLTDGRWFMQVQEAEKAPARPTLFDPHESAVLQQWVDPEGWNTVDITPDGRLALRTGNAGLEVYETASGAVRRRFFGDQAIRHARFGRKGLIFAADTAGLMHVLELVGELDSELPASQAAPAQKSAGERETKPKPRAKAKSPTKKAPKSTKGTKARKPARRR